MRIVVVEDEEKTRKGIIRLINKFSDAYQVVGESDNGLEGAALIEELRPDLIITDIRMPGTDGLEMLENLKKKGITSKSVILSGHSEFDFARRALQTGIVSEYLLKPITADDLSRVLQEAERTMISNLLNGIEEKASISSPEQLLRRYLEQSDIDHELFHLHIHEFLGFDAGMEFQAASVYVGASGYENVSELKDTIRLYIENEIQIPNFCLVELQEYQEIAILLQKRDLLDIEQFWESMIAQLRTLQVSDIVLSWTMLPHLRDLKEEILSLREIHKWSLTYENQRTFLKDEFTDKAGSKFQYPTETELRMKEAVSNRDKEKIYSYIEPMIAACRNQAVHPQEVTGACVRFASNMLHLAEVLSGNVTMTKDRNEVFNLLSAAQTPMELKQAMRLAAEYAFQHVGQQEKSLGLIIHKASKLIQERYQTGISLDELASHFNITPEYLSSLFQKELGMSFTAYMKDIRMKKAKELLINTSLKSYEVAEQVGYPDAKYFSKVFKEATGLTPGEFQKLRV
ncbi:response regulator transcription factor [Paenibacillus sp. LjRoot56]|uniref:response regulator transcription factor n=1 Tax=Paenibacillus sp. LjRoot56 TaxID=3342333 RepID=UPI003ECCE892